MDYKRLIQIYEQMRTSIQKSLKVDALSVTELKYKNYRNCLTKIKQKQGWIITPIDVTP